MRVKGQKGGRVSPARRGKCPKDKGGVQVSKQDRVNGRKYLTMATIEENVAAYEEMREELESRYMHP